MRKKTFFRSLRPLKNSKFIFILLATLPVVLYVFKFSIVYRHGIFHGEDWDYFAQMYEAARRSILEFHQFPWWNPWSIGGQPLFANPQFGLISIQMPLVLMFGTVAGLHYALLAYFVLGFWGMYNLVNRIGAKSRYIALALSYLWVFSGFPAWHLAGGHLTFANYLLAPWFFLTLLNIRKKRGWLWFSLVTALLINQAPHYITSQMLLIGLFVGVFQLSKVIVANKPRRAREFAQILKPYFVSVALIIALTGFKLIYTFQFTRQYPRITSLDIGVPVGLALSGLLSRTPFTPQSTFGAIYGWSEYASYIGIIPIGLFIYVVFKSFENYKKIPAKFWALLAGTCLAFLTALGPIAFLGGFSPFSLLHHIPVFNQMRVPSRWLGWFVFGVILCLYRLPRKRITLILLGVAIIDVAVLNFAVLNYSQAKYQAPRRGSSNNFTQFAGYDATSDNTYRLLRTTQGNTGDVYGYEPIFDFESIVNEARYKTITNRCGVNQGCGFVLTGNAEVTYWSPQTIRLRRTSSGPIELNMNPGQNWRVNGAPIFQADRILELKKGFVINDSANQITVQFDPRL